MLSNQTVKENSQKRAFTAFTTFPKYAFWIGALSSTEIFISLLFLDDKLIALGMRTYAISVLLIFLPIFTLFIAISLHISPLTFNSLKHIAYFLLKKKSNYYSDMQASIHEQAKPTRCIYKVSRVLIWGLSICSVVGIFASAIYMIIVLLQG